MLLQSGPERPSRFGARSWALWSAVVITLVGVFWTEPAHAYGWMIRHGYGGCPTCHVDPSGGELLTLYGRMQGDILVRMHYGEASVTETKNEEFDDIFNSFDSDSSSSDSSSSDESSDGAGESSDEGAEAGGEEPIDLDADAAADDEKGGKGKNAGGKDASEDPHVGFLWGLVETPPNLLLGGSFRNMAIYSIGADDPFKFIPVMMADLFMHVRADNVRVGATAGIAKVKPGSPHARAAQVTHGQGDQYNMVSRTHWLGFDMGEADNYLLRFGRINLPFGVRVPEHTLWAREATRTDRESDQQHGVALAYSGETFRTEVMGIAGNFQINPDTYRERGYSLYFEYFPNPELAVGASSMVTYAAEDRLLLRKDVVRQAHGGLARAKLLDWLSVLAEADVLLTTDTSMGYVGFAQFDAEVIQGLHLMATGEFLDQGFVGPETPDHQPSSGLGKPRFGVWGSIDWFFYNQFEFRLDLVQRQEADTQILGQLHFYL